MGKDIFCLQREKERRMPRKSSSLTHPYNMFVHKTPTNPRFFTVKKCWLLFVTISKESKPCSFKGGWNSTVDGVLAPRPVVRGLILAFPIFSEKKGCFEVH